MRLTSWSSLLIAGFATTASAFDEVSLGSSNPTLSFKESLDLNFDGCTQEQRSLVRNSVDAAALRVKQALQLSTDSTRGGVITADGVKALRQRYFGVLSADDDRFVTGKSRICTRCARTKLS